MTTPLTAVDTELEKILLAAIPPEIMLIGNLDNEVKELDINASKRRVAKSYINHLIGTIAEQIIGERMELRADVDDNLLFYVPDIDVRSVDGISPSFTNLYTRAIVGSVQDSQRQRLKDYMEKKQ